MIKFLPLVFLSVSQRSPWKNENAVYRLQISALVPEIFKFEKWVKYANEMADDVIQVQVSSLLREIKKNTKSDVPLLAVSYSYSRRAVAWH